VSVASSCVQGIMQMPRYESKLVKLAELQLPNGNNDSVDRISNATSIIFLYFFLLQYPSDLQATK
jgi:hypothetical protein